MTRTKKQSPIARAQAAAVAAASTALEAGKTEDQIAQAAVRAAEAVVEQDAAKAEGTKETKEVTVTINPLQTPKEIGVPVPEIVHLPHTKGWKLQREGVIDLLVHPETGARFVRLPTAPGADIVVHHKSGDTFLRAIRDGESPAQAAAIGVPLPTESKGKTPRAPKEPKAPKAPKPPREPKAKTASAPKVDYAKMTDKELVEWSSAREPWFMTRARQIEMQGVADFRARVQKARAAAGLAVKTPKAEGKAEVVKPEPKAASSAKPKAEGKKGRAEVIIAPRVPLKAVPKPSTKKSSKKGGK